VDLDDFDPEAQPPSPIKFVMLARMLREKGAYEFAAAARELRLRFPDWRFVLAGATDPGNPSSLTEEALRDLERDCGVEWIGRCDTVPELLASAHVVCLPTYYREGVPKALLEAAAAGRGIIATDIAGCREVVTNGVTGLLVKPRSAESLIKAMECMGEDDLLRQTFGRAARSKAEAVFGIDDVVNHHFRVYDDLLAS
ncbi:MAG: glycosyltransferase, partial [Pseudomonadota bacterium]